MTTANPSLVLRGPADLRVESGPDEDPGPGMVKVDVLAVGICGSDVHGSAGETGRRAVGGVMGHEIAGRVGALGPDVTGWATGDLVTIDPVIGCGSCRHCATARANRCARARIIGVDPHLRGGFAHSLIVPAGQLIRCSAPPSLTALVEPLAVGLNAIRRLPAVRDTTILVIGAGMIGLACVWAARRSGARTVYCADVLPDRVSRVEALGGIGLDVSIRPVTEQLIEVDIDGVVDATGSRQTVAAAVTVCPPGGTVVLVGMASPELDLSAYQLVTAERSLVGSFCSPRAVFVECVRAVESGEVDPDAFVDSRIDLSQAPSVIAELAGGHRHSVKTLIVAGE